MDLTIAGCNVSGGDGVGGLVGDGVDSDWRAADVILTNCSATGHVSGEKHVGGLVGGMYPNGSITDCTTETVVEGSGRVGGVVGGCDGTITRCVATGPVSGIVAVGGVVGGGRYYGDYMTILNSSATGDVSGTSSVGGLVGSDPYEVRDCHATGTVTGTGAFIGGLIGRGIFYMMSGCYATGNVSGDIPCRRPGWRE